MLKIIFISSLLSIAFLSCQKNSLVEPFNYERDTPLWLKEKIDYMSTNHDYFGSKIYRYKWNEKYVYHIMIPISSCAYCELYDQDGIKIQFNDDSFSDFLENKKDEVLVWEWGN
ncbi:MAG: hypothetical protein ACM339_12760 [Ignavibacteria bacterium]